jgi:hypothetical protein
VGLVDLVEAPLDGLELGRARLPAPLLGSQVHAGGGLLGTGDLARAVVLVAPRPVVGLPELPLADFGTGLVDAGAAQKHAADDLLDVGEVTEDAPRVFEPFSR